MRTAAPPTTTVALGLAIKPPSLNTLPVGKAGWAANGKRNEDGGIPPLVYFQDVPIGRETWRNILRKEVIQPQVPLRLPCYDFTPVADPTVVACLLAVSTAPSGKTNSHGVTGGVYKARERIHRGVLIHDY